MTELNKQAVEASRCKDLLGCPQPERADVPDAKRAIRKPPRSAIEYALSLAKRELSEAEGRVRELQSMLDVT